MKQLIFSFVLLAFISASCNKDGVNDAERGDFFECLVDGEKHRFTNLSAYAAYSEVDGAYTVYGTNALDGIDNPESIYVVLNEDFGPGTYPLGRGQDGNGYFTDFDQTFTYFTIPREGTGTIEIISKSEKRVKGTFNFIAFDINTEESVNVTEGSFDLTFR